MTPTTSSSSESEEQPAPLRFALVVIGFLAATVLAVVAILSSGGADELEDDPTRLGLPEIVAAPEDAAFPTLVSDGATQPDIAPFEKGVVLAVFSDGSSGAGTQTADLAAEMHRRLRPYDVRTVLVLPRESVASDGVPDPAALKERLAALEVTGDVSVLLDPADDRASGHLRRVRWQVADGNAALVLKDGVEQMRLVPPSSSSGLLRAQIAPLVKTAATLGGLLPETKRDPDFDPRTPDGPGTTSPPPPPEEPKKE